MQHPELLLSRWDTPINMKEINLLAWPRCPAFLLKETVHVHMQVWSWHTSQKQQVCRSILRTAKCSWVLQFTHTHGVLNGVCSHEGTLSAGVKLYFTLLSSKALLFSHLKKKKRKKAYLALVHIYVWCSVLWINTFHHTVPLLSFPLPKVLYPPTLSCF